MLSFVPRKTQPSPASFMSVPLLTAIGGSASVSFQGDLANSHSTATSKSGEAFKKNYTFSCECSLNMKPFKGAESRATGGRGKSRIAQHSDQTKKTPPAAEVTLTPGANVL